MHWRFLYLFEHLRSECLEGIDTRRSAWNSYPELSSEVMEGQFPRDPSQFCSFFYCRRCVREYSYISPVQYLITVMCPGCSRYLRVTRIVSFPKDSIKINFTYGVSYVGCFIVYSISCRCAHKDAIKCHFAEKTSQAPNISCFSQHLFKLILIYDGD